MECSSPNPDLCKRLKMHDHGECLIGRLWELWEGKGIDAQTSSGYRKMWVDRAHGLTRNGDIHVKPKEAHWKKPLRDCPKRQPLMVDGRQQIRECGG